MPEDKISALLGVDCPVEFSGRLDREYAVISVTLNARATAGARTVAAVVDGARRME